MSVLFEISILGTPPPLTASSLSQRSAARQDFRFWNRAASQKKRKQNDPAGPLRMLPIGFDVECDLIGFPQWQGRANETSNILKAVWLARAQPDQVSMSCNGTSTISAKSQGLLLNCFDERETWCNDFPAVQFKIVLSWGCGHRPIAVGGEEVIELSARRTAVS